MLKQTMSKLVLCITLLCAGEVLSKCEEISAKRFSREFVIKKDLNESLDHMNCIDGIILQKKLDSSLYCISKEQSMKNSEKLTCIDTNKSDAKCKCGIENPPPSSGNRIFFPTG